MNVPAQRIRIIRMIARLNVGGPARHVVWLTSALNDDEFETLLVTGIVPPGEQDMSDFAKRHGVEPLVMKQMSREIGPADAITIWKAYRLFVRKGPDIVHTHTAKAGTIGRVAGLMYRYATPGLLVGRPRRCRFVHTYHGHVFHSYYGKWKTRFFLAIERTLARLNTDRIIVLSEQQRQEIAERFGIGRPEQFTVIRLGIDEAAVRADADAGRALRRELGIGDSETVVAIIGRLTAIKNHDLFLRAAARVRGVRFVIFGDGSDRGALVQRATDLGLAGTLIFGSTRTPAQIYGASDIVALTSLNEGTPLTLIEAMSNGIPIVSTAVGGVVDLLGAAEQSVEQNGGRYDIRQRGITTASGDEVGFAAGLRRLLHDHELRGMFARRGRNFVAAAYSKDRLVADIMRLYRELID